MALEIVFQNNLDPSIENLSTRFTNATGFYISAPFLASEYQIDVYLQVYFPSQTDEQVRVIPLGTVEETAILLNITDTERVSSIPNGFMNTGLEMALLFISSDQTFIQAGIIKPDYTFNDVRTNLAQIDQRLTTIESALNFVFDQSTESSQQQQNLFFK